MLPNAESFLLQFGLALGALLGLTSATVVLAQLAARSWPGHAIVRRVMLFAILASGMALVVVKTASALRGTPLA